MDHSSYKQAAADWTAVMACPRGTLICLISSHLCGVLKLLFNYSSQIYNLNWDTLLNSRHTKRKQACYSQKKEINFLLEIKATLQALWLCIGLIQEPYSVFISKSQVFQINQRSPSDGEHGHSGLFWTDSRVKADFHLHSKEYQHFNLPLAMEPNPWI